MQYILNSIRSNIGYLFCICILTLSASQCASAEEKNPPASISLSRFPYFTIQIQAYSNKNQAQSIAKQLTSKGYSAYISEVEDKRGKIVYQVCIGKFKTRKEAETAGRQFYKKEKRSYFIISIQAAGGSSAATTSTSIKSEPAAALQKELTKTALTPAASQPAEQQEEAGQEQIGESQPPLQQKREAETSLWPTKVSKIYTYRGPQGIVGVTNALEKIPRGLHDAIESVSIFPVKVVSCDQRKKLLVVEIEDKEEKLKLTGVAVPSSSVVQSMSAYLGKSLKDKPLRLKYTPSADEHKDKTIHGLLYFRQGTMVNLEMIRLGIAPSDLTDIPAPLQQQFIEADVAARREKVGIWAQQ